MAAAAFAADAPKHKILFFTKFSGFEHDVISYKKGMPSFAEKQLLELGKEAICDFHKAEQQQQRVQPVSQADFLALGVGKG